MRKHGLWKKALAFGLAVTLLLGQESLVFAGENGEKDAAEVALTEELETPDENDVESEETVFPENDIVPEAENEELSDMDEPELSDIDVESIEQPEIVENVYGAGENWETEPNNDVFDANSIAVNTTYYGNLSDGSDNDFYKFTLPADGVVRVSFGHELVDDNYNFWNVRIYSWNDQDNSLHSENFKGNETKDVEMAPIGLPAGTYLLRVGRWGSGNSAVTYHFSLNFKESGNWEKERNDTLVTATEILADVTMNGALQVSGDVDWYRFTLSASGVVRITFGHEFVNDNYNFWNVQLFSWDDQDNNMHSENFRGNETKDVEMASIGLPAGTYLLRVGRWGSGNSNVAYHFSLDFKESENWEKERNDTLVTATEISTGVMMNGALQISGDVDWYRFTLSTPGVVQTTFGHEFVEDNYNFWNVQLFSWDDQDNNLHSQNFQGNETKDVEMTPIGLPAGTYLLRVGRWGSGNSNVAYHFFLNFKELGNWEKERNDTATTATEITTSTTMNGALQERASSDNDYYKFSLASDAAVSFAFGHEFVDSSSSFWNVNFYNWDDLNTVIFSQSYIGNNEKDVTFSGISLVAGTYIVRVGHNGSYHSDAPYHFQISLPAVNPANVTLDQTTLTMNLLNETKTAQLTATVSPEYATNKEVTWSSSNTKVATVSETGLVTAVQKGTATITVKTKSGGKKATCKVTVLGPNAVAMSKVTVKLDAKSYVWSENGVTPAFTVTYKKQPVASSQYTISFLNDSNFKAGTATAVLTGTGAEFMDDNNVYFTGEKRVKFKITKYKINAATSEVQIDPIGSVTFFWGGTKPEPVVTYRGEELTKGVDYTVSWQNHKAVTTEKTKKLPTVVVKGKGNFSGTLKATFTITPETLDEESGYTVTLKDKKFSTKKNAYRVTPVVKDAAGHKLKAGRDYEKLTLASYTYEGKEDGEQPQVGTVITVTIVGKGNFTGTIDGSYRITQ